MGSREGHVTHFLEFWDPPNISGMVEARNVKFGTEMHGSEYKRENAKLGQKGSRGGHVTHFWNFGTPLISPERLKLENSNSAQICMTESTNEKMQNFARGHVGSRDPLLEFWDPLISPEWLKLETSNLVEMDRSEY